MDKIRDVLIVLFICVPLLFVFSVVIAVAKMLIEEKKKRDLKIFVSNRIRKEKVYLDRLISEIEGIEYKFYDSIKDIYTRENIKDEEK